MKTKSNPLPAEIFPLAIRPIVDSREQTPWTFPHLGAPIVRGLDIGDYSYVGGERLIRIERKSGPDFLGSIFEERFAREMERIRVFPTHALIIEGSWEWLEAGEWRSKATSAQVTGKLLGFIDETLFF